MFKPIFSAVDQFIHPEKKRCYDFEEGTIDDNELLGYKGSSLCDLSKDKQIPVPPGFVLSTESCKEYYEESSKNEKKMPRLLQSLINEYTLKVKEIEHKTGRSFGGSTDVNSPHIMPLLFSVRSSPTVSMPGMIDTILNVGMNDEVCIQITKFTNNARFAFDTYKRFLQMFGNTVLGIENYIYDEIVQNVRTRRGTSNDEALTLSDLQRIVNEFKAVAYVPENVFDQLHMCIEGIFRAWFTPKAYIYRNLNNIPISLGTAVVIQSMVYGNINYRSGSGVCFTRDPINGERIPVINFLAMSEGDELMSGKRISSSSGMMELELPAAYSRLINLADLLEKKYSDMQRIEFTVENGEIYILQSRSGDRSAFSSVTIAVSMVNEHLITERQALLRVDSNKMDYFTHLMIDPLVKYEDLQKSLIGKGTPANQGVISGKIVFTNEQALVSAKLNEPHVLVLQDTSSEDVIGINSCVGLLIMNGSISCHSASVARELGKPVVVLACISGMKCQEAIKESEKLASGRSLITYDKKIFGCDSIITLDGNNGNIYQGSIPLIPTEKNEDYQLILQWSKKYKRMQVMSNCLTQSDISLSISLESEGCQVLPEILNDIIGDLFRAYILTSFETQRKDCLALLEKEQHNIYFQIFNKFGISKSNLLANPNNKITCKLFSSSLTSLLPSKNNPSYIQELQSIAKKLNLNINDVMLKASQIVETNPILGVRGCRLAVLYPELIAMQTKSIISAAVKAFEEGITINVEILIPLSSSESEIRYILPIIKKSANDVFHIKNSYISYHIGAEISTPRSALRSKFIAAIDEIDFITFNAHMLTTLIFGFSQHDSNKFISEYIENEILVGNPFQSLDINAVGEMIKKSVKDIRNVNDKIKIGISGQVTGDLASVQYFDELYIDYLVCQPRKLSSCKISSAQSHIRSIKQKQIEEREEFWKLINEGVIF